MTGNLPAAEPGSGPLGTIGQLPAGITHPGPLGRLPLVDGSLVFGYALVPVVLTLYAEAWELRRVQALATGGMAGLTLGAMAASAELLFAVLAGALVLGLVRRAILPLSRLRITRAQVAAFVIVLVVTVIAAVGILSGEAVTNTWARMNPGSRARRSVGCPPSRSRI